MASYDEEVVRRQQEETRRRLLREKVLRSVLSPEARQRLTNVKMVKPELAEAVENYVIELAAQGRVKKPLGDDEIKLLLQDIQARLEPKREFKIRWA